MSQTRTVLVDLVRHGETEGAGRYRGLTDFALTDSGAEAVDQLLAQHQGAQRVWCSPLQRCLQSATQFAGARTLPLQSAAELKELHFGDWDGERFETVWQQDQALVEQFWQDPEVVSPPNGETVASLKARLDRFEQQLLAQPETHHLVFTHGGVIRAWVGSILEMPARNWANFDINQASLTRLRFFHDGERWFRSLVQLNLTQL